jgi:hypothetical protein
MTGHAIGGQASDQANLVDQAGTGNHSGQVKPKTRHRSQINNGSHRVAGTKPGALPPRSTATTPTNQQIQTSRLKDQLNTHGRVLAPHKYQPKGKPVSTNTYDFLGEGGKAVP